MIKKICIITLLITIILSILCVGSYVLLKSNKQNKTKTYYSNPDAEKFATEYTKVSKDNLFVYTDIYDIIEIMQNGTGIIYLGDPDCSWCQYYAKYLNETAQEIGIKKIYYYNIKEDRKNNTEEYRIILSLLNEHLQTYNKGNPRLYIPNVSFHINGTIIGNDYETSKDTHNIKTPEEYWTTKNINKLKEKLKKYMEQIINQD